MKKVLLAYAVLGLSMAAFGFGGPGAAGGGRGGAGPGGPGGPGGMAPGMPGGFRAGGFNFGSMGVTEDPTAIQRQIGATNEEWTVIWAKLQKIRQLRAEVETTGASVNMSGGNNMMMLGAPGMPGGGSSLDAPTSQSAAPGGMGSFIGGFAGTPKGPFEAPPTVRQGGTQGGFPGGMGFGPQGGPGGAGGGGFGDMFSASGGNAVASLLSELQTLVADKSVSTTQLAEKIAAIRAARQKAKVELLAAQDDVMQLLTTRQIAALVSLRYLD